ncbi:MULTISPECIES: type II toxin-antitoxin system PemK/MazF family toxin [unclassified Microcoleus]|uniref:type II toxin-antitoxin system PemK/MazF family toxin n=1 Tax=unclassified Microcoleus TaxID=2642155 RepID=UPI002FD148BD
MRTAIEPVQGSEQAGTRPAIIVSNDSINASSFETGKMPVPHKKNCFSLFLLPSSFFPLPSDKKTGFSKKPGFCHSVAFL